MKNIIMKLSEMSLLQLCLLLANGIWISVFGVYGLGYLCGAIAANIRQTVSKGGGAFFGKAVFKSFLHHIECSGYMDPDI